MSLIWCPTIKYGKIAASYKGMTLSDYVSSVVLESAKRDIEKGHAEMKADAPKSKGRGKAE